MMNGVSNHRSRLAEAPIKIIDNMNSIFLSYSKILVRGISREHMWTYKLAPPPPPRSESFIKERLFCHF